VKTKERMICGLDVGTDKICCLIARVLRDNSVEFIGSGTAKSAGLKKGVVTHLEDAAASIRKAAQEAELKSARSVDWVSVAISGDHVQSFNCRGAISVNGKHQEVTTESVAQVMQAAQTTPVPPEREVIHVLPQEFFLDSRGDIRNPIGLTGLKLDVDVHIVTCDSSLSQNLINAVNKAQMRVRKVILPQLAGAQVVCMQDEKDLGCVLIDIGGGTTDVAVITRDALRYTAVLPVGGMHFTRDLAVGLRTPLQEAERIKIDFGNVLVEEVADDEVIQVPRVAEPGAREMPRLKACRILHDRGAEVLELVKDHIARSGLRDRIVSGAVITGGGSMLRGIVALAERKLDMPVRLGMPHGIAGLPEELVHPMYSTAVGLAMLEARNGSVFPVPPGQGGPAQRAVNRFLSWIGS
jgi:cell division protein FtsA